MSEDARHEELVELIAELRGDDAAADGEDAGDWMARNLRALARIASLASPAEGDAEPLGSIGPYELVERIGEGGMGEVFRARQTEPFRREVAVKVIKAGMDSARVLRRFEIERQTLARLDHPGIARAYDAGVTESGRPYFVMELVDGVPLTTWCETRQLGVEERLRLFLDVLDAVQHAHLRGVIHRDLKPSNVLVDGTGDRPAPKVIDFGIAKATELEFEEGTLLTQAGQLLGTPEYMSPEQAAWSEAGVDARSDVYSLGVLLYEMLAGELPIPAIELRAAGPSAIPEILAEREAKPPSTIAAGERSRKLRGDLDWIVLKALEKEPDHRYASPGEFAADIRRHLANEPVLAGPPSRSLRVRKFVRRHRGGVAAAAAIAVLLVAGIVTTSRQAIRARRAEAVALEKSEVADAVNAFLLDMLGRANPNERPAGVEMTVGEALDDAAYRIAEGVEGPPAVEAAIRRTVGRAYSALDRYDEAEGHLEAAVSLAREEGDAAERIAALRELGVHLSRRGRDARADSIALEELAVARAAFGPRSESAARATLRLAKTRAKLREPAEADSLFRAGMEALRVTAPGEESTEELLDYGRFLIDEGRLDEAEEVAQRTHALMLHRHGPDHPFTASALGLLGMAQAERGDLEGALATERRSLEVLRRAYGEESREVLVGKEHIGETLLGLGRSEEARAVFAEALATARRLHGDRHPLVAHMLRALAYAHLRLDEVETANGLFVESLAIMRAARGDHPSLFENVNDVASTLRRLGRQAEAESLFAEALAKGRILYGGEHAMLAIVTSNLAKARTDQGKYDEAAATHREALAMAIRTFPPGRAEIERIRANYGECLLRMGRYGEAAEVLRAARDGLQGKVDPGHPWLAQIAGWIGEAERGE